MRPHRMRRTQLRAVVRQLEAEVYSLTRIRIDTALALGEPQAFFASHTRDIDGSPIKDTSIDGPCVDGPECYAGEAKWSGGGRMYAAPDWTTSTDAALALIDKYLEGWILDTLSDQAAVLPGTIRAIGAVAELTNGKVRSQGFGDNRPRAILAAVLKALAGDTHKVRLDKCPLED